MTIEEFGQQIKTKYPTYKDIDNKTLGEKMLEKYPVYRNRIDITPNQNQYDKPIGPEMPAKGLLSELGGQLKGRYKELEELKQRRETGETGFLSGKLQQMGQAAGAVTDVIGTALKGGLKVASALTPDIIEKPAKEYLTEVGRSILNTKVGQSGIEAAKLGIEKWGEFENKNPNAAKNISSVVNIAALFPVGKGAKYGVQTVEKGLVKQAEKQAVKTVDKTIEISIKKAIRPSVAGKASVPQVKQYFDKAKEAVKLITENKPNLQFIDDVGDMVKSKLPTSLKQFSEAVDQTKGKIFQTYDSLAKAAGQTGLKIDLTKPASALKEIITDPVLRDLRPEIIDYAKQKASALMARGAYTAEEAQKAIKIANQSLESFYKNPDVLNGARAMVDSMIANNLRKSLDEGIESLVGGSYQMLKNQYGALKSVEKDILHRFIVNERKNVKGLIDFTNIFSSGDIVNGLLSLNPALIAKGSFQKGLAAFYKKLNDPDNIIKKMFEKVDKLYKKRPEIKPKEFKPAGLLETGAIRLPSSGAPKSETIMLK